MILRRELSIRFSDQVALFAKTPKRASMVDDESLQYQQLGLDSGEIGAATGAIELTRRAPVVCFRLGRAPIGCPDWKIAATDKNPWT
jgi:hypothetical protein